MFKNTSRYPEKFPSKLEKAAYERKRADIKFLIKLHTTRAYTGHVLLLFVIKSIDSSIQFIKKQIVKNIKDAHGRC